jgi:excinuclease UvrABC ATPase subunit
MEEENKTFKRKRPKCNECQDKGYIMVRDFMENKYKKEYCQYCNKEKYKKQFNIP